MEFSNLWEQLKWDSFPLTDWDEDTEDTLRNVYGAHLVKSRMLGQEFLNKLLPRMITRTISQMITRNIQTMKKLMRNSFTAE